MTIIDYATRFSSLDTPEGDIAKDILSDKNVPKENSEIKVFEYLDYITRSKGTNKEFQRFFSQYQKEVNPTLNYILDYFRDNNISSISDATPKNIVAPYIEVYGFSITIPKETDYPTSIMDDLKILEKMNRQIIELSDGSEIETFMIVRPDLRSNLSFFCQDFQFSFLLSLLE
jgi:hypothetical protein